MKAYFLIVHYNTPEATLEAVASITRQNGFEARILIWDNASSSENFERLRQGLSATPGNAELHRSDANGGFAAGCNALFRLVRAEAADEAPVFLLNPDLVLPNPELSAQALESLRALERRGKVGPLGACVCHYDRPDVVQSEGGRILPWLGRIAALGRGRRFRVFSPSRRYRRVDYVVGAFMLFRAGRLSEWGPMPEGYFLYGEEADWCLGIARRGYPSLCDRNLRVLHHEGLSTGLRRRNPRTTRLLFRSHLWLFRKYYPAFRPNLILSLLARAAFYALRGRREEAAALVQLVKDDLAGRSLAVPGLPDSVGVKGYP